jgi:ABC-type antimicrobial peptide transport system permease subunit
MGYDASAIAIVQMASDSLDVAHQPYVKSLMQRIPGVESVSLCNEAAAGGIWSRMLAVDAPDRQFKITGVVRDYHNQSLRQAIEPMVVFTEARGYNLITLRLKPEQIRSALAEAQRVYAQQMPNFMFDLEFFDSRIAHFYTTEETTASLVKVFAALAILISCIGLYGLVAFLAVQKMKEVGIRKVLGASVGSIVYLFSREFTLLTGLAFLISAPIGYFVMTRWLDGFYYHAALGWGVFAITLGVSLFIAWGTVGYEALRAALVNPVRSLLSSEG